MADEGDPDKGPTPTQPEGRKLNQYLATVIVAFGPFCVGTGLAWTSPVLPMLTEPPSVIGTVVSSGEASLIGALMPIGAIFGAPAGPFADKFGRKPVILAFCFPYILSWLLILFAQNIYMLFVARFIAGVGTGGLCAIIPMFIGEIAESSIRGALGSFFQMFLTLGVLYVYCLGLSTYTVIAIGCLVIPILLFILLFLIVPETPIFLMKSGKPEKAEVSLRYYRGAQYDVATELAAIQKEIDAASEKKATFSDLFSSRANLRGLIVSLGLMMFQQFSGVNTVIFYSNDIFKSAGSTLDPSISAIIVGVVQCIVTGLSVVLVDKAGRRLLLLLSNSGSDVSSIAFLPLISVIMFIVMFSLGFGPIPWMMVGELFAAEVKGIATGIAVAVNWIGAFLVTLCFGFLVRHFGSAATFWIFTVCCVVGTVFTFMVVPETKGKTLAQIQRELGGEK
ncbi:hypothetical protein M8J76_007798 [Diaphorina citri]|nr:hypothetical protein M8J76_007798 [Diaphorina citri]